MNKNINFTEEEIAIILTAHAKNQESIKQHNEASKEYRRNYYKDVYRTQGDEKRQLELERKKAYYQKNKIRILEKAKVRYQQKINDLKDTDII
jgi:tetrahydrodipicolinate N-succinyltransferase